MTSFGNCYMLAIHLAFLCCISRLSETMSESCFVENGKNTDCKNSERKYMVQELTDAELFSRGHLKPFGSHRPPDEIVEELPFMISPQDFYMKYVVKHKPVVIKGIIHAITRLG